MDTCNPPCAFYKMLAHFGFTGLSGDEANEVQGIVLAAHGLKGRTELDDETIVCLLVKTSLVNGGEYCNAIDNAIEQTVVYNAAQDADEGLYLDWAENYAQGEVEKGTYQDECPNGKYNTNA